MLDHPTPLSLDDLSSHGIDSERGFLPAEDPLHELPSQFAPWEEIAQALPKLLVAGRLRATVEG